MIFDKIWRPHLGIHLLLIFAPRFCVNKLKLALISVAAAAALLPAAAQAQLTFNLGAVSLYKDDGVDQDASNKNWRPALQGGVDYKFDNGVYVGSWNSTGRFGNANVELDLYGGYRGEFTPGLGFDVGLVRKVFPRSGTGLNGNELYFSLSYGSYSADITRGLSEQGSRLGLSYTRALSDKLTLNAGLGFRNRQAGNFDDYLIGLGYDLGHALTLSADISGASKRREVDDGSRDSRLVIGISKVF